MPTRHANLPTPHRHPSPLTFYNTSTSINVNPSSFSSLLTVMPSHNMAGGGNVWTDCPLLWVHRGKLQQHIGLDTCYLVHILTLVRISTRMACWDHLDHLTGQLTPTLEPTHRASNEDDTSCMRSDPVVIKSDKGPETSTFLAPHHPISLPLVTPIP